ncbi:Gfo/Idh/MocA family protein [Streptococcus catagoni]|uniref:Gfo/Idh/MocA family protein n=1 Tax=Streptococcus catagoni TaxID=2654874 RepID=UPI001409CF9D|nr:Gfo/Idh/MocA family oxidoreductase [Streptococcus catagoni]
MLKIGIVGLGDISQKAYLPYMRQLKDIEWHLFTRNERVRREVGQLFGKSYLYTDVKDLSQANLDGVFIHVATKVHFEMAQLFLKEGIPVYMDKPLTEDFESTVKLYRLAKANGTFLMAGFNRRFAPRVKELSTVSSKRKVRVEKNDVNRPGVLTFKLFDFFIHPLDTALFLSGEEPLRGSFQYHVESELLSQVSVELTTAFSMISISMNLQSGSRRELMEIQTAEATYQLENLDELTIFKGNHQEKMSFGSWDRTLYKRGFESIIGAFIRAIKEGVNPVKPETSLLSHWICQQISQSPESYGSLDLNLPEIGE